MRTIHVQRTTTASPEAMFDLLSDPSTYKKFPGVKRAELVRPGRETRFGVGALRRIWISGFRYEEEITRSDRGTRIDYVVISSRPPLEHQGGTIEFTKVPSGCVVNWRSTYRVPVPIVGPLLAIVGGWRMKRAFDDAIRISGTLAQGS